MKKIKEFFINLGARIKAKPFMFVAACFAFVFAVIIFIVSFLPKSDNTASASVSSVPSGYPDLYRPCMSFQMPTLGDTPSKIDVTDYDLSWNLEDDGNYELIFNPGFKMYAQLYEPTSSSLLTFEFFYFRRDPVDTSLAYLFFGGATINHATIEMSGTQITGITLIPYPYEKRLLTVLMPGDNAYQNNLSIKMLYDMCTSTRLNCFFEDGVQSGNDIFYQEGFTAGKNQGYTLGYNAGLTVNLTNPLSFIMQPVSAFFDIKLFGVVSIGNLLTVALFVMAACIFLKMFAGG